MCPPLLKTCSWVIAQFNSLWRQRLTSVTFPCVLTEDAYRRLRNLRRVFLRFEIVFSFRSLWGFVTFGKWRIFLTTRCKNWCEVSTNNLVNKLFLKFFFLAILFELFGGSSKHKRNMLRQWLYFRPQLLKKWITLFQRIGRCPVDKIHRFISVVQSLDSAQSSQLFSRYPAILKLSIPR